MVITTYAKENVMYSTERLPGAHIQMNTLN